MRLLEQSVFILVKVICARNNMVRALRRLLLDSLGESKPSEPSIEKLWFLDFETNKAGDFYLAGLMNKFDFEQVVLHQGLEGLADYQGLKIEKPEIFISSLLETIADDGGILVAYSLAEQEAISRCIPPGQVTEGIHYLNLRKAAGSWVSKFRKSEMDALPPLIKTASAYDQKRRGNHLLRFVD